MRYPICLIVLSSLLTYNGWCQAIPLQQSITIPVTLRDPSLQAVETNNTGDTMLTAHTDGKTSEISLYGANQARLSHFSVPFVVSKAAIANSIVLSHRLKSTDLRFSVCKFDLAGKSIAACIQDDGLVERLFTHGDNDYAIVGKKGEKEITRHVMALLWSDRRTSSQGTIQISPNTIYSLLAARNRTILSADVYTGLTNICNSTNMSCQSVSLVAPAMLGTLKDRKAGEVVFRDIVLTESEILVLRGRQNANVGVVVDYFSLESLSYIKSSILEPTIFADLRRGNDTTGHSWIDGFAVMKKKVIAYDRRAPLRLLWFSGAK